MARTANGFFGRLKPLTHAQSYHYARGGTALGTLGKSFAYKRPRLADGGHADDSSPFGEYARGGNVSQELADQYLRQEIGGGGIHPAQGMHDYNRAPHNGPGHSNGVAAMGGSGDQLPVKPRRGDSGTFGRGGSVTKGLHIRAPYPGHGLILSVHLEPMRPGTNLDGVLDLRANGGRVWKP